MCDSFPAISAEQLTKAVNLAAAGTLSALDVAEEEPSELKDARGKKNCFENGTSKDIPAVSKSSIQLLESLSVSVSPKLSSICHAEITPSTSFYGRARKVSTKKKPSEAPAASKEGKKYSSRKNYKLAPPLIPSGVRNTLKNFGPRMLLDSQVVKMRPNPATNQSVNVLSERGTNNSAAIRQITIIHSPQPLQHLTKNSQPVGNSSISAILPPNVNALSPQSSDSSSQPGLPNKTMHTSLSSHMTMSSSDQGDEPLIITTTPFQVDNKVKSSQFISLPKSDPIFRVPFPVTVTQPSPTSVNTIQIVRLPTALNSSNLNICNVVNSTSSLSTLPSSCIPTQVVFSKEKPKSTTCPSQFSAMSTSCPSSIITGDSSTAKANLIGGQFVISSGVSPHSVEMAVVSLPKCLTNCETVSSPLTRQCIMTKEKMQTPGFSNLAATSLPNTNPTTNPALLTHQFPSPGAKVINSTSLHHAKSSSALTRSVSRYVNIRPSVSYPKDTRTSTVMGSNVHLRPVLIVNSTNNGNLPLPIPAVKTQSYRPLSELTTSVTSVNSNVVFLSPIINQTHDTTSVKTLSGSDTRCILSTANSNEKAASQSVPVSKTSQAVPISPPKISLPLSNVFSGSQFSTITLPSCQTTCPTPVHSLSNIIKVSTVSPTINSIPPMASPVLASLTSPQTMLPNLQNGAKFPIPSSTLGTAAESPKYTKPSPSVASTPAGSVTQRMPMVVVKDPFAPKVSQQQGTVRLTVYPLPQGFNLVSNGNLLKSSTNPNTCEEQVQHNQASPLLSGNSLTKQSSVQEEKTVTTSSQCVSNSTCLSTASIGNLSNAFVSALSSKPLSSTSNGAKEQQVSGPMQSPNTNTPKLVISPAGILHLQSLLRQMGTSEGYFIISTPRSSVNSQPKCSQLTTVETTVSKPISSSFVPHIQPVSKENSYNISLPVKSSQSMVTCPVSLSDVKCSSITTSSPIATQSSDASHSNVDPLSDKATKINMLKTDLDVKKRVSDKDERCNKDKGSNSLPLEMIGSVETEGDDDDNDSEVDSSSSAESTCSSNALVIETNDHVMDSLNSSITYKNPQHGSESQSSSSRDSTNLSNDSSCSLNGQEKKDMGDVNEHSSTVHLDSNLNSPLSLGEIVSVRHQYRFGAEYQPLYSPPFPNCKDMSVSASEMVARQSNKGDGTCVTMSNTDSSEIRFPIPESPLSSYLLRHHLHQQQSHSDNQPIYEQSLNTPHSLYTHHDLVNEVHMHNSSDIEAAMNLQRLSECPPAPPPPSSSGNASSVHQNSTNNPGDANSPKSPLSSQQLEPHTPLHPPMTPNTMLINLLNRVPTPLLTNHQDLLSVPSSQENEIHFQGNCQVLESSVNKKVQTGHGKSIELQENLGNTSKEGNSPNDVMYNTASHSVLADSSESFGHTQNALDLIASNYLPSGRKEIGNALSDQLPTFSSSGIVSSQNMSSFSRSWNQDSFAHCNNFTMTFSAPEYNLSQYNVNETHNNMDQPLEKSNESSHCKSCSVPITITINLDSDTVSLSNTIASSKESSQTIAEPHHESEQEFHHHQHQLPQQQCVLFDGLTTLANPGQEKCRDAEIIRHLIMNTGNNSNHQLFAETSSVLQFDACNQHFEHRAQDSFLTSHEDASNIHGNVSESNPQFGVATFEQRISMSEPLSEENCHETFNNISNSDTLMYENNSSYENVQMDENIENCSFNCNSSTPMTTYRTSANSVFDSSHNTVFSNSQNSTNSSFIMPGSLPDIQTSFDTDAHQEKEQILHPSHIQSDRKLTQSSEYTSDIEHNDLFFHQSSTSDSHSSDLPLYDMGSLHEHSHELGYSISGIENHDSQLKNHQGCLQSSHCSDIQRGLLGNRCDLQGRGKQIQDHAFDFSIQQTHQYTRGSITEGGSDVAVTFSNHQTDLAYINEPFSSHFYTNSASSNLPMFSQQCAVGSEAPLIDTTNPTLNCSLSPYKSSASGMQLEYHYQPQDASEVGEKHPVLPSASFSPPSVADPAVTPDPGTMEMYNGTFQNLSAYDNYLRGGHSESRSQLREPSPEFGKFCVECNTMYKTGCKFHPFDCRDVSDAPILSHARLTLPPCLKLGPSSVVGHTNNTGVFAKETIAVRTKFGPLIGSPVSCDQMGSTRSFSLWQTFVGSNIKVMDTSDENSSNWLMFVKPARVSSEQNLVAFQQGNRVFFVTRTEVVEGQELLYWFSKDYARMLGISSKPKNAQHQLCPHCPVCKQVFADRKQVRSHIRLQHPKPQINKCSHCSRGFSQVSHLNAHILAVHLRVKKFVCNHCGKRFGDSSNLRKHVKSHSDERNFKCQMCNKAFRQKAHLQVHMNSHMPVKHEQCRFCGNRFTRAFERKQHELQHTKQNRIECQHCSKVFYKQKIYKEHLKIHRNERNFPCNHCGKAFRNKFALTRHGPACKQRKRSLSLIPADTRINILSHHANIGVRNSNDFSNSKGEDSLNSSSVSSSGLSSDL